MKDEAALLIALQMKEELFALLEEVIKTEQRKKVFIEIEPGLSQGEIGERASVNQGTVSRAINAFEEFGLVKEVDDGYKKTLECMDHPLMSYLWKNEVLEDG